MIYLSTTREAPSDVVRRLRELDPTADVIYLGWGRWNVGKVRPTSMSVAIAQRMLATYWAMSAKARNTRRGIQRYRFAEACAQGFRPVAEYTMKDLDGRVVKDFQESQYRMLNARTDLLDDWERAEQAEREARRLELIDENRARDTIRYVKTSNFGRAVESVRPQTQPARSGFTKVASI